MLREMRPECLILKRKAGEKKWGLCGKTSLAVHKTKKGEKRACSNNFFPCTAHLRAECIKNTCKFMHSNVIIFLQQYSFASKLISEICFLFS